MHREIQIKQFPIITTHWWPKTRNERFVWENEQYLYSFLPLVHNHVQVIWVHTCIRCVTCVCARSGSRCFHTGRRRQRLMEGVSEAWCWRAVIVTNNQSHTSLVLHERDWVFAWGDLIGWRLRWHLKSWKVFNCREQRQWSDATDPQFSSATLDVTPFKVNERRWRRRPRVNGALVCASAGKRRKWSLARIRHSLPERTHTPDACAHSDHLDMVVYKR